MTSIFISYARHDLPAAQKVARLLEDLGWDVWWDRDLIAGDRFDEVIEQQLGSAAAVIVLWSRASVVSEWVRSEASAAAERRVLVPARIDHTPAPFQFRLRQTVDLSAWAGDADDENVQRLVAAAQALAGPPPPKAAPLPPPTTAPVQRPAPPAGSTGAEEVPRELVPPAPSSGRRRRTRSIVIAAVTLAAIGILAAALLRPGSDDADAETLNSSATTEAPTTDAPPTTDTTTPAPPTTEEHEPPPAPEPQPAPDPNVLQRGSKGDEVIQIQAWLALLGYEVSVDGHFGSETKRAVEQFEADNRLDVDGMLVIDQEDWQLLRDKAEAAEPTGDMIEVPDVFNKPVHDAHAELHAIGFELDDIAVCSNSVGEGRVRQVLWTDDHGGEHVVVDKPGVVADNRAPVGTLLTVKVANGQPCA
jgi:TIR domain/Putative peptidoglycan binding domain